MPGYVLLASRLGDAASAARLFHGLAGLEGLVYSEDGGSTLSYSTSVDIDALPWRASRGAVMVAASDWVCVYGLRVVGGHALAWVLVCAATVPQSIRHAVSLPLPLRREKRAWLMGYAWRLLDEGSSTERLAARLVLLGARASIVAVVAEQRGRRTPVALMAGERLCVVHRGRLAAAATAGLEGCTLLERSLVTLKLQAGVPRVEVRYIDEYRR